MGPNLWVDRMACTVGLQMSAIPQMPLTPRVEILLVP